MLRLVVSNTNATNGEISTTRLSATSKAHLNNTPLLSERRLRWLRKHRPDRADATVTSTPEYGEGFVVPTVFFYARGPGDPPGNRSGFTCRDCHHESHQGHHHDCPQSPLARFNRAAEEFKEMVERHRAPCEGFVWFRWLRPSTWHAKQHHVDLLCGVSVNRYCVRCGKEGLL